MSPNDLTSEPPRGTAIVSAAPLALLSTLHWPSQVHPFAQHPELSRCYVLRWAAFGLGVVSFAPFRWGIPLRIKRLYQSSDVTILEDFAWSLSFSSGDNIHHRSGQVVSSDHLIGKQGPKYRVDSSHEAIAKIWLLSGFHGVDVGGPENGKPRKPRGK